MPDDKSDRPDPKAARMLNVLMPTVLDDYVETETGGLLVRNVKLLASGTWTDSKARTPLHYPAEVLEAYATNWLANGYWARHSGGAPRSEALEKLGTILNPRYSPQEGGVVMGDIFFDRVTQASRDGAALAIAKAKAGNPQAVSVEHDGDEVYDPENKRYLAKTLVFLGAAGVDEGACRVCKFPKRLNESQLEGDKEMDDAAIAKLLADQKADLLGEMDKRIQALKVPADQSVKVTELSAALEESRRELGEAKKRIEALEKKPNPRTTPEGERALEAPVNAPRWDPRTGRVGH